MEKKIQSSKPVKLESDRAIAGLLIGVAIGVVFFGLASWWVIAPPIAGLLSGAVCDRVVFNRRMAGHIRESHHPNPRQPTREVGPTVVLPPPGH